MRRSGVPGQRRKRKTSLKLPFAVAVILGLTLLADCAMRPAIENMVAYQTRVFASRQINEAMLEQLERTDSGYGELVRIIRGSGGEIMSIQADMAQINRLKSRMSASVIDRLQDRSNQEITVPIGTIAGNQLTAGRGPLITVRVAPVGYVQSEIFNRFSSAGINQTLHQIMLRINVQMIAVLPGYSVKTETETDFCIAETVIVGEVPLGYAAIGGEKAAFAPAAQ